MKTPRWVSIAVGLLVALSVLLIALVIDGRRTASRSEKRIARIEKEIGDLSDAAAAVQDVDERLGFIEDDVSSLQLRIAQMSMSLRKMGVQTGDGSELQADLAGLFPGIDDIIEKKVTESLNGKGRMGRTPSLADLSKELGLSQFQEKQASEIINGGKAAASAIVSAPRADGTSILDEFSSAILQSDRPAKEAVRVMLKLYVDKVPGTNETYYDQLKKLQADTEQQIGGILTEDQYGGMQDMDLNVFGVQTGYNPLADHFRALMAQGK